MSVTAETVRAVLAMRLAVDAQVDAATRALARQWGVAWQEIVAEFQAAANELVEMVEDGRWPSRTKVLRAQHAANAIKAAVESMQDLANTAGVQISGQIAGIVDLADTWSETIIGTQLPVGFDLEWSRVDKRELEAMVKRTTQRIHSLTRPLSKITEQRMKATLIHGVAVGDSPDAAARLIVTRSEGVFNGGLSRATNIARTELLDASREAARQSRIENHTTVEGWRWHCDLSAQTCPACLSQNGDLHPAGEIGPNDHPQGRCTAVPVTRTWRSLGIDLDEPEDDFPDARAWFAQQTEDVQRQIMGARRLKMFQDGDLSWEDMAETVHDDGWRDSIRVPALPAAPK